ncbi:MAG: DEAD/DEAH box helicase [Bacillota bacterium]|nr:DEAD/DEAH box helicase [Bacillota bacterium]
MFEINKSVIKEICRTSIYNRGMEYNNQGKVYITQIDYLDKSKYGVPVTSVKAAVKISPKAIYNISIEYSNIKGFLEFKCDCGDYYNSHYYNNNICSHIAAVLINLIKEKDNINKAISNSRTEKIINQLNARMVTDNIIKKSELKLEIILGYEMNYYGKNFFAELKIGENKIYVVKNLNELIKAIIFKKSLEFGKFFTYNPQLHTFSYMDKEIINLFREVYEINLRAGDLQDRYRSSNIKFLSGRRAFLTELQFKRLLEILKGHSINCFILNERYFYDVNIIQEDLPLEFDLKLKKNNMVLASSIERPVPVTNDGEYFFYKENIYKPSLEQINIYTPFYNNFIDEPSNELSFDISDSEKIASFIVPNLRKISKSVNVDKNLENNFYEEPLKTNIYFDKVDDYAAAELKFNYGDIEINPLKEPEKRLGSRILIRDVCAENDISAILQGYGFTKADEKYVLKDEEKLVDFLMEGLEKLQDQADVYYSEAFKGMKIYGKSSYKSSIRLNDNNLLEFSFKIEDVDNDEIKKIFYALREKKKYYRLKKGGFISLESEELKNVNSLLEYLDIKDSDIGKDKILLNKYNAMYIDQKLKQNELDFIEKNKKFRELVNNIKDVQELDYSLPKNLDKIMRPYQKIGFKWFKTLASCNFGGIIADEMGLGKTLQTIAFIASEAEEENRKPSLVVCPTSLAYNWKDEVEKFAPELKALVISGNPNEREEQRKEIDSFNIVITTYPLIRRDIDEYKEMSFKYCFLDEAQQIKNPMSINAQSVKEIKAEGYFAITGTPLENSLSELWSIFDFIMPGYLLSHRKFASKYESPIVKNKDKAVLDELNKHIKPFILRRLKKDVMKELPPKIEHKVVVEMTDDQKKLYMTYVKAIKDEIDEEIKIKGFEKSRIKILAGLTRLRQICCDPSVFVENFSGESGKITALLEILEDSIDGGHRILLFSQFTTVLKNISQKLTQNKIEYLYLDGNTKTEERGKLVKEFNEGRGSVFLISLKAGGMGLNLTGADVVMHFDPWWNPAVESQATDRAHRIGQKKTVEVIKLIARGTIEEKIYELQEKKKEIIKNVIDYNMNEEDMVSKMTQADLESLFS